MSEMEDLSWGNPTAKAEVQLSPQQTRGQLPKITPRVFVYPQSQCSAPCSASTTESCAMGGPSPSARAPVAGTVVVDALTRHSLTKSVAYPTSSRSRHFFGEDGDIVKPRVPAFSGEEGAVIVGGGTMPVTPLSSSAPSSSPLSSILGDCIGPLLAATGTGTGQPDLMWSRSPAPPKSRRHPLKPLGTAPLTSLRTKLKLQHLQTTASSAEETTNDETPEGPSELLSTETKDCLVPPNTLASLRTTKSLNVDDRCSDRSSFNKDSVPKHKEGIRESHGEEIRSETLVQGQGEGTTQGILADAAISPPVYLSGQQETQLCTSGRNIRHLHPTASIMTQEAQIRLQQAAATPQENNLSGRIEGGGGGVQGSLSPASGLEIALGNGNRDGGVLESPGVSLEVVESGLTKSPQYSPSACSTSDAERELTEEEAMQTLGMVVDTAAEAEVADKVPLSFRRQEAGPRDLTLVGA
ncbi:unnamed protein product, partial [Choristocarpus tenellus]